MNDQLNTFGISEEQQHSEIRQLKEEMALLRAEIAALRLQMMTQVYARPCVSPYPSPWDWWRTPVYSTGTLTSPTAKFTVNQ